MSSSATSEHGTLEAKPAWVDGFEWIALAGFSLGLVLSKALATISLAGLLPPFIWHLIYHRSRLMADPMIRVCACWMLYVTALGIWETHSLDLRKSPPYLEVFGFALIPLFAMALHGRPDRVGTSLLLALLGVLIRFAMDGNWFAPGPLYDYANSQKALGVNRNISGPLVATALLGLFLWFNEVRVIGSKRRWLYMAGILSAMSVLIYAWTTISSRATWISLVVALLASFYCVWALRADYQRTASWRPVVWTLTLVGAAVGFGFGPTMIERLSSETDTWRALLRGDWDNIPFTSIGIRYRLAHLGFEYFQQHPLTGWGPTIQPLIANNTLHPEVSDSAQLHNGMLELLVRTGLTGLAFVSAATIIVYRAARELPMHGEHGHALFAGLIGTFIIIAINNCSISLIYFQHGWQLIIFAGGIAYGHRYRRDALCKTVQLSDRS